MHELSPKALRCFEEAALLCRSAGSIDLDEAVKQVIAAEKRAADAYPLDDDAANPTRSESS